jgi:hypothetical protein
MKKFGTPIGAGPGSANENVGLSALGTPPEPLSLTGPVAPVAPVAPVRTGPPLPLGLTLEERFWERRLETTGARATTIGIGVALELGCPEPPDRPDGPDAPDAPDAPERPDAPVVPALRAGTHDSHALETGTLPGTEIGAVDDEDWLTTNVSFWPLCVTTVTVHVSSYAEAAGTSAMPAHASDAQTPTSPYRSFRVFSTSSVGLSAARSVSGAPEAPSS